MGDVDVKHVVRHFRHILLWPLQLRVDAPGSARDHPWNLLARVGAPVWRPVMHVFDSDAAKFRESQYKEFVSFLPYVQRFLYGDMRGRHVRNTPFGDPESPMRVLRRDDVAFLRAAINASDAPIELQVARVELHFFHDMDVTLLAVELHADNLPLEVVEELLYRFGRAYPSGWDENGQGVHNLFSAEWLAADRSVLAKSDSSDKRKFLQFMGKHRTPAIARHWAFLLQPLVLDAADDTGPLRYRQLEYHRMPMMAYLAMENPRELHHDDFVHLGLLTSLRPGEALPRNDPAVAEFNAR